MKKILLGSLVATSLIYADSLSDAFKNAKVDGEFRVVNYTRTADDSDIFGKASGTAGGVELGISTKSVNNLKTNIRFFSTTKITGDGKELENTNLVDETSSYALLGVANIEYNDNTNMLKIGRQELHTPLVASDDARVVKDLFEAVNFTSKIIPNTTLHTLYISKNSGMDNGANKSEFVSMSETLGASYDRGMFALGLENSSIKNTKFSAWYYRGIDFIDMAYADASYSTTIAHHNIKLEGHYWKIKSQSEFEKDTNTKIDYDYGGARLSVNRNHLTLQLAQERINLADNSYSIHTSWGMYSEYTYGFLMGSGIYGALNNALGKDAVTKVDATKVTAIYGFSKQNAVVILGYDWFNADSAQQSDMNLFDILVGWDCLFIDNASWQVIYENWDVKDETTSGISTMVDNNLIRAKFTYKF